MLNRTLRALNRLVVRRNADAGLDVRAPDRAAASVALRGQGTSRRVRLLGALSLAALLLATFAALPLQAQTTTVTLVSNIEESSAGGSSKIRAQSFRTGSEPIGYRLSEVHLRVSTAAGRQARVRIRVDDSGSPGNLVDTLINPTLSSNRTLTFTALSALVLEPNKTYWLTVNEEISSSSNRVLYRVTSSDVDTSDQSWSIGNGSLAKDFVNDDLSSSSSSLIFEISGTLNYRPDDATLRDLSLEDASNGSAITLSPGFSAGHPDYSASVEAPVSRITVIPTKSAAGASIASIRNVTTGLSFDADTSNTGFQVDLLEGAQNEIKVEVTAEDGTTTETYTLTVTRAAEPGLVLVSKKSLSLTEGEVSPGVHAGARQATIVQCDGRRRRACGHAADPESEQPDLLHVKLESAPVGERGGRRGFEHDERIGHTDSYGHQLGQPPLTASRFPV